MILSGGLWCSIFLVFSKVLSLINAVIGKGKAYGGDAKESRSSQETAAGTNCSRLQNKG